MALDLAKDLMTSNHNLFVHTIGWDNIRKIGLKANLDATPPKDYRGSDACLGYSR